MKWPNSWESHDWQIFLIYLLAALVLLCGSVLGGR